MRNLFIVFISLAISACSKSGGGGGTGGAGTTDPCAGIVITVTANLSHPTNSASNGIITATATGGTASFTYSINNGPFQGSPVFQGLVAGNYTIVAKNANGCTGSGSFVLTSSSTCTTCNCNGITINVGLSVTGNLLCITNNASIQINAAGGTGPYTYSINGAGFQTAPSFIGLGPGSYTIIAKDANGCTGSSSTTVTNLPAGPLFTAVKQLLQANCTSCHNTTVSEGGMNWEVDCNIVLYKDRIKARAVDGIPFPMPATGLLPQSERNKITNWINAGGRFSD